MLVLTGNDSPGPAPTGMAARVWSIARALVAAFPMASLAGAAPGLVAIALGLSLGGWGAVLVVVLGLVVAIIGGALAIALRLKHKLTVDVPSNLFGICRGLGTTEGPGFTDWLSDRIDDVAGLDPEARPLRFGHLWTGTTKLAYRHTRDRSIDLRMVSTCLSQGRPYELPWAARNFFYDPATWATLFPAHVMKALHDAPPPAQPEGSSESQRATWLWEDEVAAAYSPPLRRLPDSQHLPVIVATRLSLSFPLLISAVPLYAIDLGSPASREAITVRRKAIHDDTAAPTTGLEFCKLWFTDGGLCSNFPLHLFDAALTSRPTFAINLGSFEPGQTPSTDQRQNVELATSNRSGLLPPHTPIPESGMGAVAGFASAALNTARNWQDGSYLDQPGYRDRIVRVLQTRSEGGLNLTMDGTTINGLAARGRAAAEALVDQFTEPHYPERDAWATGWDNHRWVRYRAFLACLPDWLGSYARGRAVLCTDLDHPPSYALSPSARTLAADLTRAMDEAAAVCANASPSALAALTGAPSPQASIRRIPRI
jgi:hypothetical protein